MRTRGLDEVIYDNDNLGAIPVRTLNVSVIALSHVGYAEKLWVDLHFSQFFPLYCVLFHLEKRCQL